MPEWARPEIAANGQLESRLQSWTREEFDAIGLPDVMPVRPWFPRTGADTVERRCRRLLAQKTAIEHQLMELMTSPVGGFAVGEPAFNS
jgi:hypothetical protein